MKCPRCKADLPEPQRRDARERTDPGAGRDAPERRESSAREPTTTESSAASVTPPRAVTPEDALRVESPPAPCPQCGWSTMWNE